MVDDPKMVASRFRVAADLRKGATDGGSFSGRTWGMAVSRFRLAADLEGA